MNQSQIYEHPYGTVQYVPNNYALPPNNFDYYIVNEQEIGHAYPPQMLVPNFQDVFVDSTLRGDNAPDFEMFSPLTEEDYSLLDDKIISFDNSKIESSPSTNSSPSSPLQFPTYLYSIQIIKAPADDIVVVRNVTTYILQIANCKEDQISFGVSLLDEKKVLISDSRNTELKSHNIKITKPNSHTFIIEIQVSVSRGGKTKKFSGFLQFHAFTSMNNNVKAPIASTCHPITVLCHCGEYLRNCCGRKFFENLGVAYPEGGMFKKSTISDILQINLSNRCLMTLGRELSQFEKEQLLRRSLKCMCDDKDKCNSENGFNCVCHFAVRDLWHVFFEAERTLLLLPELQKLFQNGAIWMCDASSLLTNNRVPVQTGIMRFSNSSPGSLAVDVKDHKDIRHLMFMRSMFPKQEDAQIEWLVTSLQQELEGFMMRDTDGNSNYLHFWEVFAEFCPRLKPKESKNTHPKYFIVPRKNNN